jgi:hydroxymethylglutaryl-CoA reductase (NADPH)
MSVSIKKAAEIFQRLGQKESLQSMLDKLAGDTSSSAIRLNRNAYTLESHQERKQIIEKAVNSDLSELTKHSDETDFEQLKGSIENFIGFTQVPTGIVGPVRVNGSQANGDFLVPLATTEGALVASYHRGAKATLMSGGITSVCLSEGVRRSPLFGFKNIEGVMKFLIWLTQISDVFKDIVAQTTNHGVLNDTQLNIEGNQVIITFEYITGDASGQNMVTLCTDAICHYLVENSPIKPKYWYVESNYSGDKKASSLSFTSVRGKKVTAECVVKKDVLERILGTTANSIAQYWRSSTVSVIQSGSIGAQGHFANGLTALYMATGQDVACVAEAAVGVTRMEVVDNDSLYVCVTMPNIIVGTVGGGTKFDTQQECLKMLGCSGTGMVRKYAEICGALLLCGELSIAAALAEGHFTSAHKKLGRSK